MDFYEAQEEARKRTRWLAVGFFLSVITVMILIGMLCVLIFQNVEILYQDGFPLEVFIAASLIAGGTILFPYIYKSMQLSRGGEVVALDMGGRQIDGTPSDFHEQRLLNVVEEMALASGVPVPMVYVMDHEESINAFAAGTEPTNAVIGVTRGCLERLTREELQGVIAHEFSHILNGDMKMNMRMIGWVFGLMGVSMIGQMLFRSISYGRYRGGGYHGGGRGGDRDSGNLIMVIIALGVGLMIIGGVGVFFGRLLQAAISRQREYLADASAVQFTRNPESIAGALEKIGGLRSGSEITAPKASEASHMFFADGGLFSFGFATHPPLAVRIKRIKADWSGTFPKSPLPPIEHHEELSALDSPHAQLAHSTTALKNEQDHEEEYLHLPENISDLPPELINAAHNTDDAQLMIFSMLVASEGGLTGLEAARLIEIAPAEAGQGLVSNWSRQLEGLHSIHLISLIDLSMPTLRRLSYPMKRRFISIMRELISADQEVSLFEYMLQRAIERHVLRHAEGRPYSKVKYTKLRQIEESVNLLTETMKRCAQKDYKLSTAEITELDAALNRCEHTSPRLKRQLIKHLTEIAGTDTSLTSREAELLRTTADAIGYPFSLKF